MARREGSHGHGRTVTGDFGDRGDVGIPHLALSRVNSLI
jgi:hypothetical protein